MKRKISLTAKIHNRKCQDKKTKNAEDSRQSNSLDKAISSPNFRKYIFKIRSADAKRKWMLVLIDGAKADFQISGLISAKDIQDELYTDSL